MNEQSRALVKPRMRIPFIFDKLHLVPKTVEISPNLFVLFCAVLRCFVPHTFIWKWVR